MLNLGSSITVLIVGRLLQGLSAAVVWVVGLALLADNVGKEEVGQTMAWVFMGMSLAMLVGPLLGGVVFTKAGYNWVFGMTYIIIGIDIAMRLMIVEKKLARKWLEGQDRQLPQVKSADEAQKVGLELSYQKERGEVQQENNRDTIELADVAAEPAVDTVQPKANSISQRPRKKLRLPPVITLLKSRRLLASLWGTIVLASLLTQFDSVLPLHVRHAFNWNSTGAGKPQSFSLLDNKLRSPGLVFLPLVIPSFIGPVVGWAVDRFGPRWLATAGFVVFAPFEMLLRLVTHDTLGQKVLLCVLLAFIGLTLDLVLTPLMAEIAFVVASKEKENPSLFGAKGAYAQVV
jgi:MFS family permease